MKRGAIKDFLGQGCGMNSNDISIKFFLEDSWEHLKTYILQIFKAQY